MQVHIGVENDSGLILSVESTAANVHDLTPAAELLSEEKVVYVDAGFRLRGLLLPRPSAERGGATRTAAR
jgi:IS5 family transposase